MISPHGEGLATRSKEEDMKVPSFPVLVYRLAQQHHDGALLVMAMASGVPQSTLWRWVRGLPTHYSPELVRRVCDTYDLAFTEVWEVIARDTAQKVQGKKVPLPDLSSVTAGPVPKRAHRR